MDNIKMEKQRTNAKYKEIIKRFSTPKGFWNGLYPWVTLQSFGKGCVVGITKHIIEPNLTYSQNLNNIILGLTIGLNESLIMTPIIIKRNEANKQLIEKTKVKINITNKRLIQNFSLLLSKRCLDWSFRFLFIDFFYNNSNIESHYFNIFFGSAFSTIISTPIDRLIPLVNDNINIKHILKEQGILFFYKGFIFRFLSTGYYSLFVLLLPELIFKDN